ncbi:MAG: hypothetical protein PHP53_24230 [Prolixibacteraceae bacterium]|nr:hypothetical protein [Prolixibacteraceae bacterium]
MEKLINIYTESLPYSIPAITISLLVAIVVAIIYFIKSNKIREYKDDMYRQNIEKEISYLSKKLCFTEERFKDTNHLIIESQKNISSNNINNKNKNNSFYNEFGIDINQPIDNDLVFVLTPFNNEHDDSYSIIKRIVESVGFVCKRGDEKKLSKNILPHIIEQILKARLVIANISGRNPNVFYELGIAHSLGKDVLLIAETINDVPFDLKHIRILTYKDLKDLESNLKDWLIQIFAKNNNINS